MEKRSLFPIPAPSIPQRLLNLLAILLLFNTLLSSAQQCPHGTTWCRDRCGGPEDICCQTPDGKQNLCGRGTLCCGFGCCPNRSYTCNADHSCTAPDGIVIPPATNPNVSDKPEAATTSSVMRSLTRSDTSNINQSSVSNMESKVHPSPSMNMIASSEIGSTVTLSVALSSFLGSVVVIDTETVTFSVASLTTLATLGHTIVLVSPTNTASKQAVSTLVIGSSRATKSPATSGQTSTATLTEPGTSRESTTKSTGAVSSGSTQSKTSFSTATRKVTTSSESQSRSGSASTFLTTTNQPSSASTATSNQSSDSTSVETTSAISSSVSQIIQSTSKAPTPTLTPWSSITTSGSSLSKPLSSISQTSDDDKGIKSTHVSDSSTASTGALSKESLSPSSQTTPTTSGSNTLAPATLAISPSKEPASTNTAVTSESQTLSSGTSVTSTLRTSDTSTGLNFTLISQSSPTSASTLSKELLSSNRTSETSTGPKSTFIPQSSAASASTLSKELLSSTRTPESSTGPKSTFIPQSSAASASTLSKELLSSTRTSETSTGPKSTLIPQSSATSASTLSKESLSSISQTTLVSSGSQMLASGASASSLSKGSPPTAKQTATRPEDGKMTRPTDQKPSPGGTSTTQKGSENTESPPAPPEWPAVAVIAPVDVEVEMPKRLSDGSIVIPCKSWFFSICTRFDGINILGWQFTLPPGIYPPGPPPLQNIKFPPSIQFKGELPPWPKFTVGADGVPTFPPEPKPTECATKTASLCSASTSFVVSTAGNTVQTISSQVLSPTCAEVRGCLVAGTSQGATMTSTLECSSTTAVDATVTCSGNGTASCTTKLSTPKTGCSVTPTTTTVSCTPAPTGNGRRDVSGNICPASKTYFIWPKRGISKDATTAIYNKMREILHEQTKIKVSESKALGINFWWAPLDPGQAQQIKEIPNVVLVYPRCEANCGDFLIDDTPHWRYQRNYIDVKIDFASRLEDSDGLPAESHHQLHFISKQKNDHFEEQRVNNKYFFDSTAGEDVPVYIIDTGAQISHQEFTEGDNIAAKTRFLFIGDDYDGKQHMDDSNLPLSGICEDKINCKPHGTSMLSLVAGANLGVAKKVKPTVVRFPRMAEHGGGSTAEDFVNGLSMILDEFPEPSETTRAILSLSISYVRSYLMKSPEKDVQPTLASASNGGVQPSPTPTSTKQADSDNYLAEWVPRAHSNLKALIERGVFIVTGIGNGEIGYPAFFGTSKAEQFDKYPELTKDLFLPELLVVGAANPETGKKWLKSVFLPNFDIPHVYAPGEEVVVANGDKGQWNGNRGSYKRSSGTSDATAYTAGLAAYFLKLHQVGRLDPDASGNPPDMSPAGLKRYIINNAWLRHTDPFYGKVLGIWNGAKSDTIQRGGYCPYRPDLPANKLRFRELDQCVKGTSGVESTVTPSTKPQPSTLMTSTKPSDTASTQDRNSQSTPPSTLMTSKKPSDTASTQDRNSQSTPPSTLMTSVKPPETTSKQDQKSQSMTASADPPKKSPEEEKITPLELGERHCHDASIYTGKGDIHENTVWDVANNACHTGHDNILRPEQKIVRNMTEDSVLYIMTIEWKPNCKTTVKGISLDEPLRKADVTEPSSPLECLDLLYGNWEKCTGNKGRGGYIDVGCARFDFTPKRDLGNLAKDPKGLHRDV